VAVKPCRECGREVSTSADACPGCGTPWPANPQTAAWGLIFGIFWIALLVFLVVVFFP